MKIYHQIEMPAANLSDETKKRQKSLVLAVLVNQNALIDIFIATHQITQRFIRQKRDMRLRIIRAKRPQSRRHQQQITDVHRIDDQNRLLHPIPAFSCHFLSL